MPIGGSFAPALIQSKVSEYRELANTASNDEVKYHMGKLCDMMDAFYSQPKSKLAAEMHPVAKEDKNFTGKVPWIVPLEKPVIDAIWDHVPFMAECNMIADVFESIPAEQKDLRNAAFHLLWFAKELTLDRTPLTADQLR